MYSVSAQSTLAGIEFVAMLRRKAKCEVCDGTCYYVAVFKLNVPIIQKSARD